MISTDYTARLNELLDERERVHVFELLWSVAYADGEADAHEAHLLRRLGDRRSTFAMPMRSARSCTSESGAGARTVFLKQRNFARQTGLYW